jgi:hypothetical protein
MVSKFLPSVDSLTHSLTHCSDNGHPRAKEFKPSLKYSNYGGRYSDGPVSTEYMKEAGALEFLGVNYTNYAYGNFLPLG